MQPDGDVLIRRSWLVKAEAAATKLQVQRSPGTPPGPRGSGATSVIAAAPARKQVGDGF
jgi:hypothetical protein